MLVFQPWLLQGGNRVYEQILYEMINHLNVKFALSQWFLVY